MLRAIRAAVRLKENYSDSLSRIRQKAHKLKM
jgi:hypothetical protein